MLSAWRVPYRVESNNLAYLTVRIYEFEVEALADPGASYTFIRLDEIRKWEKQKGKRLEIQPSTLGPIQSSNCGHQQCVGQFNAFLHIGEHSVMTTFYVVDQQPVPILLGSHFFRANRAIWDFETDTLVLRPAADTSDEISSFPSLTTSTDIHIPASSSVLIRCKTPAKVDSIVMYTPRTSALLARGLLSCAAIIDGNSDTIPVNLVNLSSREIVVPATTKLGILSCVAELQTGKSMLAAPSVDATC